MININEKTTLEANLISPKQSLKKTGLAIGLCLLLVLLIEPISQEIFNFSLKFMGLYDFASKSYSTSSIEYIVSSLCFGISLFVPCVILSKFIKEPLNSIVKFNKVDAKSFSHVTAIGFLFLSLATALAFLIIKFTNLKEPDMSFDTNNIFSIITAMIANAVCPALFEEFLFRGVVLGSLRKYGDKFAIIVSSILFAIIHINLPQVIFAFICGITFGLIVVKTNSLIPTIIIHFINNFLSCLMIIGKNNYGLEWYNYARIIVLSILILIGLLILLYVIKKDKSFFNINYSKPIFKFGTSFKYLICNWSMIVFLIFLLITIVIENFFNIGI